MQSILSAFFTSFQIATYLLHFFIKRKIHEKNAYVIFNKKFRYSSIQLQEFSVMLFSDYLIETFYD